MDLKELKYKANYYTLLLLTFVLPLERRLGPPLIGLFVLTSFFNLNLKRPKNKKILLFTSLFFIYLFSLLYTSDLEHGIPDVVRKLSLLVFPIAFYISDIDYSNKLDSILNSFIDGCLVSGLLSLISSAIHYYFTLDSSMFFYGNSSVFLHTSYYAMSANFSILFIYYLTFNSKKENAFTPLRVIMLLFFSAMVVISASKTGLISLIIIHSSVIIYWITREKKWLKGLTIIAAFLLILITIYSTSSKVKERLNEFITVTTTGDTSSRSTTAARVEIWKIALELIKKEPFLGYGTEAGNDKLIEEYKNKGFLDLYQKQLNAHNQFLQTALDTGLLGGIVLLLFFAIPIVFAIKKREYLYLFFLLLVLFNFLTEAMLERQSGVVFYALFNALFFRAYFDENSQLKINT